MSPRRRKRLDPGVFQLPVEQIRSGAYTDADAALTAQVLRASKKNPRVTVQVTTTQDGWLSGIDESIAILKQGVEDWSALTVNALYEGDLLDAWDTVMTIDGELTAFAHLEALYLGVLGHRTRVCTNLREIVDIARPKPVVFVGGRDEHWAVQPGDGFAAMIAGAKEVATAAQATLWNGGQLGGVPDALVAAFGGDTAAAVRQFAKHAGDDTRILAPVDYENDVARTAVEVARALGERLWGVRVGTPEHLVDRSLLPQLGAFRPTGVNPQLVWNVRNALDAEGFGDVQIVVAGAIDAERVQEFQDEAAPVDVFAVGSAAYRGMFEFVADVVAVEGKAQVRAGRVARENPKLERVK